MVRAGDQIEFCWYLEICYRQERDFADIEKGSVDLQNGQIIPVNTTTATAEHSDCSSEISQDQVKLAKNNTTPGPYVEASPPSPKRRKTGGMRPVKQTESAPLMPENSEDGAPSARQVHTETRFPQRKKLGKEVPVLEPTSVDKLIAGIWKQLFSSVQLTRFSTVYFLAGNSNCIILIQNRFRNQASTFALGSVARFFKLSILCA